MNYCCVYVIEERLNQRLVHRNTTGFLQNHGFCKDWVLNPSPECPTYLTILSHNDNS